MDFTENIPLILAVIAFIALQFFMSRRHKTERTPTEIVQGLLLEIEMNLRLIEATTLQGQLKKFKTGTWKRNNGRLDFLDEPLRANLSDAYTMAEDFNQQIAAAKKRKSIGYVYDINVDKLAKPLTSSKQELEEWLQSDKEEKGPISPKYPGLLDMFFGKG